MTRGIDLQNMPVQRCAGCGKNICKIAVEITNSNGQVYYHFACYHERKRNA